MFYGVKKQRKRKRKWAKSYVSFCYKFPVFLRFLKINKLKTCPVLRMLKLWLCSMLMNHPVSHQKWKRREFCFSSLFKVLFLSSRVFCFLNKILFLLQNFLTRTISAVVSLGWLKNFSFKAKEVFFPSFRAHSLKITIVTPSNFNHFSFLNPILMLFLSPSFSLLMRYSAIYLCLIHDISFHLKHIIRNMNMNPLILRVQINFILLWNEYHFPKSYPASLLFRAGIMTVSLVPDLKIEIHSRFQPWLYTFQQFTDTKIFCSLPQEVSF